MRPSYFGNLSTYMYPSNLLHYFGVNGKVSGSVGAIGEMSGVCAVLHGPRGCGFHYRNSARRRHQPFYALYSTDLTEREVIEGGAEKLRQTILEVHRSRPQDMIMVVPTPISDILNEDIDGVVSGLRAESIPVVAIRSELFSHRDKQYSRRRLKEIAKQPVSGAKNLEMELRGCGFTEAMYAVVEHWMEPCEIILNSVNIETVGWGPDGRIVLREIETFLAKAGISVFCWLPSASAEVQKKAPSAQLNIAKRVRWAKRMKEKFGTDYLHLGGAGRHHGFPGIRVFYEDIAEKLGLSYEMKTLLNEAVQAAEGETALDRAYLGTIRCGLVCRSAQMAPHILRQYVHDFGFHVTHLFVQITPEARRELGIDGEMEEKLMVRVREAAEGCGELEIHVNASEEIMRGAAGDVDILAGSSDATLTHLGVPILHPGLETTSLSFESYVRTIKRIRRSVENRMSRPDLLLTHMSFSQRHYPLLETPNTLASREMWERMWLYRKEDTQ